jgi:hypothetical protein
MYDDARFPAIPKTDPHSEIGELVHSLRLQQAVEIVGQS